MQSCRVVVNPSGLWSPGQRFESAQDYKNIINDIGQCCFICVKIIWYISILFLKLNVLTLCTSFKFQTCQKEVNSLFKIFLCPFFSYLLDVIPTS